MTPTQMIGWTLNQTSSITNIVSTRIYNGNRLVGSILPAINYFEIAGGQRQYGFERKTYSINCRAATAETALQLARLVTDLFYGTSSTGIYGTQNGFEVTKGSLKQFQGLISEPDNTSYNAPVDIFLVYPTSSIT